MLDCGEVEAVDPDARVSALHLALQVVEGPSRMLQRDGVANRGGEFYSANKICPVSKKKIYILSVNKFAL